MDKQNSSFHSPSGRPTHTNMGKGIETIKEHNMINAFSLETNQLDSAQGALRSWTRFRHVLILIHVLFYKTLLKVAYCYSRTLIHTVGVEEINVVGKCVRKREVD